MQYMYNNNHPNLYLVKPPDCTREPPTPDYSPRSHTISYETTTSAIRCHHFHHDPQRKGHILEH